MHIRLGNLARDAQSRLWFWRQAGIEMPKLTSAFKATLAKTPPARDGEFVRVPLLRETVLRGASHEEVIERLQAASSLPAKAIEMWVPLPVAIVRNPRFTVCLRAPDDEMRPIFRKGDILALDTSSCIIAPVGDTRVVKELLGPRRHIDIVEKAPGRTRRVVFEDPRIRTIVVACWIQPGGFFRLVARGLWLSGPEYANVHLSGEPLEIPERAMKVRGMPGRESTVWDEHVLTADPKWAILGRVIAWIGSADLRPHKKRDSR